MNQTQVVGRYAEKHLQIKPKKCCEEILGFPPKRSTNGRVTVHIFVRHCRLQVSCPVWDQIFVVLHLIHSLSDGDTS